MAASAVDIFEIRIPLEAVKRLSDEDRFSYYLLGHMFNEIMALQKMVGFSLPKHEDRRPARVRPEHAQAMLLFRLASGKIWESALAIRGKHLAATLRSVIFPKMPDGPARLKELNIAINEAPWLSPLRNGMGFHAPQFDEWKGYIIPDESWVDDSVFLGKQSGNTFYDAADSIAQAWMFGLYGVPNVRDAVDPLIEEMIELLRLTSTFIEDCLGVLIARVLLQDRVTQREIGKVLSPQHDRVAIPFWTAMPPRPADS